MNDRAASPCDFGGRVLGGRYHVSRLIAAGGMADVYEARDSTLERAVAVKVFRAGATDLPRFRRETALLAGLQHEHLVRLYDAGEEAGRPFLVLELCRGSTLAQRLASGAIPSDEAAQIGRGIADALAFVHAAGVVHRDVKPSNVLLSPDGHPLLADFGVAMLLDGTRLTASAVTIGTPAYLAPEQISGSDVTAATDVYALGLVLLEALTGRRPFEGTQHEQLAARAARPPSIDSRLPPGWRSLLTAMTALDPDQRPTAAAARTALDGIAHGRADAVPATASLPATTTPLDDDMRRPRRLALVLAALAFLAGIAVAAVTLASGDDATTEAPPATTQPRTDEGPGTTAPPPTATGTPSTAAQEADLAAICAQLEEQKRAIEAEKQRVEEEYRDDPETRERLKEQLEDQKKAIDEQKQQLGC